jgi:DNA sulfur modification protein DndB
MRFTARDGAETSLQVHGVLEANDGQIVGAAALKHLGMLLQPTYIIHDDVIAGRLVPLLTESELQRLTINIAYPTQRSDFRRSKTHSNLRAVPPASQGDPVFWGTEGRRRPSVCRMAAQSGNATIVENALRPEATGSADWNSLGQNGVTCTGCGPCEQEHQPAGALPDMATIKAPHFEVEQGKRKFYLTKLPAKVVSRISYAAVRGRDLEEGAIQRVLNTSRIAGIKAFTLAGGDYPNAIVLNWVSTTNKLKRTAKEIAFLDEENSAQIIDGQHRVAGIREAIEEREDIGELELPVVVYNGLTTKECADIFLSINEEQKPAPRSLVFDLFGLASSELVDPAAVRARDIALTLNDDPDSPYNGEIKLPGGKMRKGGIALSTAVVAIKPLVEDRGSFDQIGLSNFEDQRSVILNLFLALKSKYGEQWEDKDNAFLWAAGFTAALQFLNLKLMSYCSGKQSFEKSTIAQAIVLNEDNLIHQSDIKGFGGSRATQEVYARLLAAFRPAQQKPSKFKI